MVKNPSTNTEDARGVGDPWWGKIPESMKWQPAPVFLPRKCHGQRIQAGYSPWRVTKELAMTE